MKVYLYVKKTVAIIEGHGFEANLKTEVIDKYKIPFNSKKEIKKHLRKMGFKNAFNPEIREWYRFTRWIELTDGSRLRTEYSYLIGL